MKFRCLFLIIILISPGGGCGLNHFLWRKTTPTLPTVLSDSPQPMEIVNAVNANSLQMKNFVTNNATIHINNSPIPISNCSLAFERSRKFRAMGSTAVTGPLFDLGSNEELFWIWGKSGMDNAMYYCRHAQYPTCPARNLIPIDPDWLIESMGIVNFKMDGSEQHELLPRASGNGPYVIQTTRTTPGGVFKKRTVIDRNTACVLSQTLYGPNNQIVAIAESPEHKADPTTNIIYPRSVQMTFVTSSETFHVRLDLGNVQFNVTQLNQDAFIMPDYAGYTPVDICTPQFTSTR
ncbi:MAG: hypothetical protein LBQ54_11990 [Planctomycetaceae bacterium]|jgi:hypothetical protein|nr:hypothetical protein [Planctomycetaceae bacterium]